MTTSTPQRFAALLVIAAAIACIAVPMEQLLGPGPFLWHVHQSSFWQGGLEAIGVIAVAVAAFIALGRKPVLALPGAIVLALYLRRHAVDVPFLLDLAMVEIAIGVGVFVLRRLHVPAPRDVRDYLHAFVLGFLTWSLAIWLASVADAGSIPALRILTVLMAILAVTARHTPLVLHLWRALRNASTRDRAWSGALAAWIAVLFARAAEIIGYDSLWYGFRSEYVLDPARSLFEPLGLVSPVYYFPKLYEAFLLPLGRLGDTSVLSGMSILLMALALATSLLLMRRIELPERARMPLLAVIATLPALANTAVSPKPDVASLLFVLLAADAAFDAILRRGASAWLWLLACATLACLAKLTAIPYVGALLLATLAATMRRPAPAAAEPDGETRAAIAAAILALVVAMLVTARTWWLTGVPTIGPDPLLRLWNALGMHLAEPAGTLQWTYPQDWSDVPALVVDWLFRPQRLPHVVIAWVGNVWFWCALLAIAAAFAARGRTPARERRLAWPLVALVLTGALLAVAIRYHVRGSDGNYFLAALLPAILLGASAAFRRLAAWPHVFSAALICLPAFAAFQAATSFVSAEWQPGTRAFDLDFTRDWRDREARRAAVLAKGGLASIAAHLRAAKGAMRAVGHVDSEIGYWLPARFEPLLDIVFARGGYLSDADAFLAFLRAQRIDALIMPRPGNVVTAGWDAVAAREAFGRLQRAPGVKTIEDRDYIMLDLREWQARGGELPRDGD